VYIWRQRSDVKREEDEREREREREIAQLARADETATDGYNVQKRQSPEESDNRSTSDPKVKMVLL
jgi:hypothetical protein